MLNFKSQDDIFQAEVEYNPILAEGEICTQFVIHSQTSESKELQEQLSYISERDLEADFLHGKSITDKIQEAIEATHAGQPASTFIQIDIANIDMIHDQYGVAMIDKLSTHITGTA